MTGSRPLSAWPAHPAKRAIDLTVAGCLLVVLSPVLGLVAVLVRVLMGRPVLFRQPRTGLLGRTFVVWKFRTMAPEHDAEGRAVPEAARITALGRWLRASSLDELPQLVHVLRGDMSLVGPRPLLPRYLERYSPEQARRHLVRPGVTGLSQVGGRNAIAWGERLRLDVRYVEEASPAMDLAILRATVRKVLRAEGISTAGHPTSPEFTGDRQERPASTES